MTKDEVAPAPLTPDLIRRAERAARRAAARYGDPLGDIEGAAYEGLEAAARRWAARLPAVAERWTFDRFAMLTVARTIAVRARRRPPLGYRFDARRPGAWRSAPAVDSLDACRAGLLGDAEGDPRGGLDLPEPLAVHDPPEWPVDYQDWVEGLASAVGGRCGEVLRLWYLDARGGAGEGIAPLIGAGTTQARLLHRRAIGILRARLGVAS
jgi:hypothetical protein